MADNTSEPTTSAVDTFLEKIPDEVMKSDSRKLIQIMREETGEQPYLWGSSIVGFGSYHYKYESGREGDSIIIGFSPRKQALTLYGIVFYNENTGHLDALGKHTSGKGCLYIKKLSDIDEKVLRQMISTAYKSTKKTTSSTLDT